MVRNEVVPQLRFSPPRLLPSGVFQLAGNVRIVSDERHDYGHMFAMQGGPRSARVVPNTKIALDPLYPTPRRQPKFRVSGYSGGLTALKTDDEEGEGAAAIKDVVQLDHLQVHVSNKSPYTVSIECSIGGIVKQMSFNRGAARFNGLALDWRAEALTLLAAVVDDGLANCGKQRDPAASTVDEEQQLPGNRDGDSAELDSLRKNIDGEHHAELAQRGRLGVQWEGGGERKGYCGKGRQCVCVCARARACWGVGACVCALASACARLRRFDDCMQTCHCSCEQQRVICPRSKFHQS